MARKPRHLSAEERAMWERVAQSVNRTSPVPKRQPDAPAPKPKTEPTPAPVLPPLTGIGMQRPAQPLTSSAFPLDPMTGADTGPVHMDRKTYGRMRRGKLVPEARIDLHGMTAERAHSALAGFILRSQAEGKRLVLVITGKGRAGDRDPHALKPRQGVLRHAVPDWLALPPLNQLVLQVTSAHRSHGGGGAYYIYLRRTR